MQVIWAKIKLDDFDDDFDDDVDDNDFVTVPTHPSRDNQSMTGTMGRY